MGLPSPAYYDHILLQKIRALVEQELVKSSSKNKGWTFSHFCTFLDPEDRTTKTAFRSIIQETFARVPVALPPETECIQANEPRYTELPSREPHDGRLFNAADILPTSALDIMSSLSFEVDDDDQEMRQRFVNVARHAQENRRRNEEGRRERDRRERMLRELARAHEIQVTNAPPTSSLRSSQNPGLTRTESIRRTPSLIPSIRTSLRRLRNTESEEVDHSRMSVQRRRLDFRVGTPGSTRSPRGSNTDRQIYHPISIFSRMSPNPDSEGAEANNASSSSDDTEMRDQTGTTEIEPEMVGTEQKDEPEMEFSMPTPSTSSMTTAEIAEAFARSRQRRERETYATPESNEEVNEDEEQPIHYEADSTDREFTLFFNVPAIAMAPPPETEEPW